MKNQYSDTIQLSYETIAALQYGNDTAGELITSDVLASKDKIVGVLRDYERLKANGGHIYSFTIENSVHLSGNESGSMMIHFPIQLFNGCQDLNQWTDDKMKFTFRIDETQGTLTITGEEIYTRDGEEF